MAKRKAPAPAAAPPRWPEAEAAFAGFERARDRQDSPAMVASLAQLAQVLRAGAEAHQAKTGELSAIQARFVSEYLVDLNGAAAAKRAGSSATRTDQQAYEWLQLPAVAAAITAGKARQMASAELSATRVLEELRRIAFSNARDFWHADGRVKHPTQLTAEEGACLAGFEVLIKNVAAGDGLQDTIHKFKLWDKVHSLELLAKHFELLVERVKVDTTSADARVARLIAARKRVTK